MFAIALWTSDLDDDTPRAAYLLASLFSIWLAENRIKMQR
jgi:hypothetical protein